MRVYITGIAGFIGRHLARALIEQGHQVAGCDVRHVPVKQADWTLQKVEAVEQVDCDVLVHLAAIIDAHDPDRAGVLQRNMGSAAAAALLAKKAGARLVVASSAAANEPSSSGYAMSKWALERLAFAQSATALRFANVYGDGSKGVIAQWQSALIEGRQLEVSGDGTQTRDFIHVDDVVAALVAAVESDAADGMLAIDVCTGKQRPIIEIARRLSTNLRYVPRRDGDPDAIRQSPTLLDMVLGIKPSTDLAL